ncbi:MAG: DUF2190 family protein [Candidatus Dormibacteraeota bacterium]|nr:DUF2190 family protein [Candidatus Dormibacteraeota bacterium]
MAANRVRARGRQLSLPITFPAAPASGDPVFCGSIPGVALSPKDAAGNCVMDMEGVYNLTVTGACNAGDIIYGTGASPVVLSTVNTGIRFGYALATQAGTGVIPVKLGYGG